MARQRISEFRAKMLLFDALELPYSGTSVYVGQDVPSQLSHLSSSQRYVVKVDQGVKKRMKRGLITLDTQVNAIPTVISDIHEKGYSHFIIEPMASYDQEAERYLALERQRDGYRVFFSKKGGIDIEEHESSVQTVLIPYSGDPEAGYQAVYQEIGLKPAFLKRLVSVFEANFFSFLEINPLVITEDTIQIIDLAVEVDSVAEFFVDRNWTAEDYTFGEKKEKTQEEQVVAELKQNSQAAFTLDVLNSQGSIFMLLSGGGASLVLADEVANMGKGSELANYGEYSGNPNQEETYLYTQAVLSLLLRSQAEKKVLIVGGGVANFTDIRATFKGVIHALSEKKQELRDQHVKVFVRRGGPNQKEGLAIMRTFLEEEGLLGRVVGPDVLLTDIIHDAIQSIQ